MTTKAVTKIDPLPDTMSGLITVALADLKKAEASPQYIIQMGDWHTPANNGKTCHVCFAGAVMAGTLKASPLVSVEPDNWWDGIANKLSAINDLRQGDIESAAVELSQEWPTAKRARYNVAASAFRANSAELCAIPTYTVRNRDKFHAALKKLATALEAAGL